VTVEPVKCPVLRTVLSLSFAVFALVLSVALQCFGLYLRWLSKWQRIIESGLRPVRLWCSLRHLAERSGSHLARSPLMGRVRNRERWGWRFVRLIRRIREAGAVSADVRKALDFPGRDVQALLRFAVLAFPCVEREIALNIDAITLLCLCCEFFRSLTETTDAQPLACVLAVFLGPYSNNCTKTAKWLADLGCFQLNVLANRGHKRAFNAAHSSSFRCEVVGVSCPAGHGAEERRFNQTKEPL